MRRLGVSTRMAATEILRNRAAMLLLFLIPAVLYAVIRATASDLPVPFQLSAPAGVLLRGSDRNISLVLMGTTAMCGLMAFFAFVLTFRPIQTDRRLVFEGFRPWQLLGAKVLVVAVSAAIVACYVTAMLLFFYRPPRVGGVWLGFFLAGLFYGMLGIMIGVLSVRDLGGMLVILLLVNIDPGWLQNPVLYPTAHNRVIIHWLPSYHPCQVALLSAFNHEPVTPQIVLCGAWLLVMGLVAAVLYRLRIGIVHRQDA